MTGKPGQRSKKLAVINKRRSQALRRGREIDGRTRDAKYLRATLAQLCEDLGGAEQLSIQQQLLVSECAWQAARLRNMKAEAQRGGSFDDMRYSAVLNSLLGMFRTLGIERKAKPAQDLHQYMAAKAKAAP